MSRLSLSVVLSVILSTAALAESRVFVIASNADTYGVDRCLVSNERCGTVVARAYCQAQNFSEAKSYRKIEQDELTQTAGNATVCRGSLCSDLVAIECVR